jgi:hypothetical protein
LPPRVREAFKALAQSKRRPIKLPGFDSSNRRVTPQIKQLRDEPLPFICNISHRAACLTVHRNFGHEIRIFCA